MSLHSQFVNNQKYTSLPGKLLLNFIVLISPNEYRRGESKVIPLCFNQSFYHQSLHIRFCNFLRAYDKQQWNCCLLN